LIYFSASKGIIALAKPNKTPPTSKKRTTNENSTANRSLTTERWTGYRQSENNNWNKLIKID